MKTMHRFFSTTDDAGSSPREPTSVKLDTSFCRSLEFIWLKVTFVMDRKVPTTFQAIYHGRIPFRESRGKLIARIEKHTSTVPKQSMRLLLRKSFPSQAPHRQQLQAANFLGISYLYEPKAEVGG